MISRIVFKKINFHNLDHKKFNKYIIKSGLFVFPAAPALASVNNSPYYYKSLQKADLVFFDSGLFVLLLRILKNINVIKFSGYKFLSLFFEYIKNNNKKKIFCIDTNLNFSRSNKKYFQKLGIKKIYNYIAPIYNSKNVVDKKLLNKINKIKPNYIIINIGGGTQEVLGLYLKKNLKFRTSILCLGAAISFFTRDQAPINDFVDKYYLGWLLRFLFNPFLFFKKYLIGLKLIPMVFFSQIKVIK